MKIHPSSPHTPAAFEPLEPRTLLTTSLVADLNETPTDLDARAHITVRDTLYFTASSNKGRELWKTDGTPKGTSLLKDINPGVASSDPGNFTRLGRFAYFTATHDRKGHGLWRTDGTRAGTTLVKALPSGHVHAAVAAGDKIYFSADAGGHDFRDARDALWVSDGTRKGTQPLFEAPPDGNLDLRHDLLVYRNNVLFIAGHDPYNRSLYRTKGTPKSTRRLDHIDANSLSLGYDAVVLGRHLLFEHTRHDALWAANFKRAWPVAQLDPGSYMLDDLTVIGDELYFTASDGAHGEEPWVTDGTPKGTHLLNDIAPGDDSSDPYGYTAVNGSTYFVSEIDRSPKLWKTDGTPQGTAYTTHDVSPRAVLNGSLLVTDQDALGNSLQLHALDPATNELTPLTNFTAPAAIDQSLGVVNGRFVFTADSGNGPALWSTDGTPKHTRRIRSIRQPTTSAWPSGMNSDGQTLYFGTDNINGAAPMRRLEIGDGTLWKLDAKGRPQKITDIDGEVARVIPTDDPALTYFTVGQTTNSYGIAAPLTEYFLWRTDGTAAGTRRILDEPMIVTLYHEHPPLARLGDSLAFLYNGQLWTTDGTPSGTEMLIDATPTQLLPLGDDALLVRDDQNRLWRTDGAPDATRVITDASLNDGRGIGDVVVNDDGQIYYAINDHVNDEAELWTTDGTPDGNRLLKHFDLPDYYDRLYGLSVANDRVYFEGYDPRTGFELWTTDGTPQGTRLLKDVRKGPESSRSRVVAGVGNLTYFLADDAKHGRELWRTDGTRKRTTLVADLRPGPDEPFIQHPTVVAGNLLFSADDGIHGAEPWIIRPNQPPTLLADIFPGRESSDPTNFTPHNNLLYFSANDYLHGRELWSTPL